MKLFDIKWYSHSYGRANDWHVTRVLAASQEDAEKAVREAFGERRDFRIIKQEPEKAANSEVKK